MSSLFSHGMCLANDPALIVRFQIYDLMFWVAYTVISIAMLVAARSTIVARNILFALFWVFIFFCGQTHAFDVLHKIRWSDVETSTALYYADEWIRGPGAIISLIAMTVVLGTYREIRRALKAFGSGSA